MYKRQLERSAETLSGGEAQRIRLASQIGSGLTGVMYVLDEPSIGLHQRDNGRLLATLKHLRDLGNTVIVVEHDEEAILAADHVLDMTIDEAVDYFAAVPSIREKFLTLQRVGLGYVKVGQPATTLSGGEAQRVKLSKELSRRATGQTLYILDEPTTGLHFEDVRKLLEVLHALVEQGNTVVVIEHNLDVIKTADWVLDLGPGGGVNGGEIVAEGTPEAVAANDRSFTGQYLRATLAKTPVSSEPVKVPKPSRRTKRASEDQPDLIAAK